MIVFPATRESNVKTVMMPMKRRNWHSLWYKFWEKILLREVKEMLNQPTDTNWSSSEVNNTLLKDYSGNAVEASDGERVFAKHTSKILARIYEELTIQ